MKPDSVSIGKRTWMISLLLIATMFLWGCGGGDPSPEPAESEAPEAVEEPADEPETEEAPATEEGQEISETELAQLFGSGQALDEMYYEMIMTGLEVDGAKTRIWLKSGRMRSESEMGGQLFIMIYDDEAVYTLDPQSKMAMKISADMGMDETMDPYTADDFTGDVDDQNLQYLGRESVNGIPCHVVQSVDTESGHGVKMWLHENYGFPMRVESLATNPDEQYTMEVTEFKVGNVADSQFDIPSDYQIIDMGEMFQNMPEMPVIPGS